MPGRGGMLSERGIVRHHGGGAACEKKETDGSFDEGRIQTQKKRRGESELNRIQLTQIMMTSKAT